MKARVSERALIARINRKLKEHGCELRTKRGLFRSDSSGPYYVVHLKRNIVVLGGDAKTRIDLQKFARKLEALADYETFERGDK